MAADDHTLEDFGKRIQRCYGCFIAYHLKDMYLGEDFYDSFIEYQKRMLHEFDRMKGEYGFRVVNASQSVRRVAADLRRAVARVIDSEAVSEQN